MTSITPKDYLRQYSFKQTLDEVHRIITEKCLLEGQCFDAWYTNNEKVLLKLKDMGKCLASRIREDLNVCWCKRMDTTSDLWKVLDKHGRAPKDWEDSPDGTLAGLAVILAGWVANQLSAKARDKPSGKDIEILLDNFKLLVNASIELGNEFVMKG